MDKNLVLVSVGLIYKERGGSQRWFVVKQAADTDWELPKVIVRRGESSVRAIMRIIGEKGGMSGRVIEEVGRSGGVTTVNNKTLPQRHIFYLMVVKNSPAESFGFKESAWLEYSKAAAKLVSKREKTMLKDATALFSKLKKTKSKRQSEPEEE